MSGVIANQPEPEGHVSAMYYNSPTKPAPPSTTHIEEEEMKWREASPPSYKSLQGKVFNGWYQSRDLTSYTLPPQYLTKSDKIDMKQIIDSIPNFIISTREISREPHSDASDQSTPTPPEISHAQYFETDNRLLTHTCEDCDNSDMASPTTMYILLDYLLEISVPQQFLRHFTSFQSRIQSTIPRSRPQSAHRSSKRWVFTQCHCDVTSCYGNLEHTLENVVPVLVVPYERYAEYFRICSKSHVIMRLPRSRDHTTGYTMYWVQKIAQKLSLEEIWIIDDQVKSLYRSLPHTGVPVTRSSDGSWSIDVGDVSGRLVGFSDVMKHLEDVMLHDVDRAHPISILGVSNEIHSLNEPFTYNIPYGMVLLNLKHLRDVKFHPELHQLDLQVLACEAVKCGQRVFVSNMFVLMDSNWNS